MSLDERKTAPRPEDDPRLTAYALGELDAEKLPAVEALLVSSEEARRFVDEMKAMAAELEQELSSEGPAPRLSDARRREVERHWSPAPRLSRRRLAIAAALLVGVSIVVWRAQDPSKQEPAAPAADETIAAVEVETRAGESRRSPSPDPVSSLDPIDEAEAPTQVAPELGGFDEGWKDDASALPLTEGELSRFSIDTLDLAFSSGLGSERPDLGDADFLYDYDTSSGGEYRGPGDRVAPNLEAHDGLSGEALDGLAARPAIGHDLYGVDDLLSVSPRTEDSEARFDELQRQGEAPEQPSPDQPSQSWKPSVLHENASRLRIGDHDELPLQSSQVQVRVDGFRARVIIDQTYTNPHDRPLEGNFQLRLPEGASPYFFAFGEAAAKDKGGELRGDVFFPAEAVREFGSEPAALMSDRRDRWREPREARMVPKEKANRAYHDTVRQRVDPALMEWSGAGVFQGRVFPLQPGRNHRVVIGYDVDLVALADGSFEHVVELPREAGSVALDLRVRRDEGTTIHVEPEAEAFENVHDLHFHLRNPEARRFVVRVSPDRTPLLVGEDTGFGAAFATVVRPEFGEEELTEAEPGDPRRAVILVDTSLSASPEKFGIFARLLPELLAANEDRLTRFAVLFFDVHTRWWREEFSENDATTRAALAEALDRCCLEGATDLGAALRAAARPGFVFGEDAARGHDLFLLGDGAMTWGETDLEALSGCLHEGHVHGLYAYRTGLAGTDLRVLHRLARETGGAVFHVPGEDAVAPAARAWRSRPWTIADVRLPGAEDLLLEGAPTALYPGQPLVVTGRGRPEDGAALTIELQRDGRHRTMELGPFWTLDSELATRRYGQMAVQRLEGFALGTERESRAYATQFRVPGRSCSLLMLESEADYQRYDIRPEDEAYVVRQRPVQEVLTELRSRRADELRDPKARFLAWLDRREQSSGLRFELSEAFRLVLEQLPAESFRVETEALRPRLADFEGTPGRLVDLLAARRVDYDLLSQEAQRRREAYGPHDALKALSSLVEVNPGDAVVLRDVAFSASEWELPGAAYHLLRRVVEFRPHEPQTYWNMALCLERMGKIDLALVWYELAVQGSWDARFGPFSRIAGMDYLRLLRAIVEGRTPCSVADYAALRRASLQAQIGLDTADVVVVMQWNTDRTDVDLHVFEPPAPGEKEGEHCYYSHPRTAIGGVLTPDVTQGYGPEMYVLENKPPGPLHLQAHYFASDRQRSGVRSKVLTTIFRDWGEAGETVERAVWVLTEAKQQVRMGTVDG